MGSLTTETPKDAVGINCMTEVHNIVAQVQHMRKLMQKMPVALTRVTTVRHISVVKERCSPMKINPNNVAVKQRMIQQVKFVAKEQFTKILE